MTSNSLDDAGAVLKIFILEEVAPEAVGVAMLDDTVSLRTYNERLLECNAIT